MIKSLAYVGFTSPNAPEWEKFGPDILGLEVASPGADGSVRLRMDNAPWRISVRPATDNGIDFVGWEIEDDAAAAEVSDRLSAAGYLVQTGDAELRNDRGVRGLIWFVDRAGIRHELGFGRVETDVFRPGREGFEFVTGDGGLGHIVLLVPDLGIATELFEDILGLRPSDTIDEGMHVRFYHCNSRHHSLALTALPQMAGVHHLMLEVPDIDQVGMAYDLASEAGCQFPMSLGRHTNDQMTSFYVRTPSGFEVEYGTGGLLIDQDEPWPVGHYDAMSLWGHKPPVEPLFPEILYPVEPT